MSLPSDMVVLLDASRASTTFALLSYPPHQESSLDTAGVCVQATPSSRPDFDNLSCAAGPSVVFGGVGAPREATPTFFNVPSQTMAIPGAIVFFGRSDGAANLYEMSTDVTAANGFLLNSNTALTIRGPGGTMTATPTAHWYDGDVEGVAILECDGTKAGTRLWLSNVAVPLVTAGVDPGAGAIVTVGFLGANHAVAGPLTGACALFGFLTRVTTAADRAAIQDYCATAPWYLPPAGGAKTRNIISIGDSISVAAGAVSIGVDAPTYAYPLKLCTLLGARVGAASNFGISGARLTTGLVPDNILRQWVTDGGFAAIDPTMLNIILIEGGVNDFNVIAPSSFATALAAVQTVLGFWQTVVNRVIGDMTGVANGPHIVIYQTINGIAGSWNGLARLGFNDYARTLMPGKTVPNVRTPIVDTGIRGDAILGSLTNSAIIPSPCYPHSEGLHPGKIGQRRWAGMLARKLLTMGV